MDLEEIRARVAAIKEKMYDGETAHIWEDELHEAFIEHVANAQDETLARMAREVLKTSDMDFDRWHA